MITPALPSYLPSYEKHFKPVNWIVVLGYLKTITLATYNKEELTAICKLAGSWVSCAVGNQCKIIPRHTDGEPFDKILNDRGIDFYHKLKNIEELAEKMVCGKNQEDMVEAGHDYQNAIIDAQDILDAIERRSAQLIAVIKSKTL